MSSDIPQTHSSGPLQAGEQEQREAVFQGRLWRWRDLLLTGIAYIVVPFLSLILLSSVNIIQRPFSFLSLVTLMFMSAVGAIGGLYFLVMRPRHLTWQMIGLRSLSIKWQLGAILLSLLQLPLSILLLFAINAIFKLPTTEDPLTLALLDLTWVNMVIVTLLVGIVVPFYEEVIFRGLLYSFVRERWGVWVGALVSAFLFALMHPGIATASGKFLFGLLCVFVYERSKSLWAPIIIHAVNNLLAAGLGYVLNW